MSRTDRNRPLYMISVAADLTNLHPQTLRMYEAKGLVTPKRTSGNTRMYSQADIERLTLISQLTDEGINLAGVLRILDQKERCTALETENDRLRSKLAGVEDQLHEMEIRHTIATLSKEGESLYLEPPKEPNTEETTS